MEEEKVIQEKEELVIKERKEKIVMFFKKSEVWVYVLLLLALYIGFQIRMQPMVNHGDHAGLWDITTNSWTLGPDLDPWLFERTAETIINTGKIPEIDMMRNVPYGIETSSETKLLPYMMVWTYQILKFFDPTTTILYASAIFPVILFLLTILSFFFFVREIFLRKDKESRLTADIIAIISTFIMIVIPVFLSRTVAGIPEKESAAFFFIFIAYFLFIKSWKTENIKISLILSILAGIATALTGLVWGGVSYIYVPIALSFFIAFIFNKVNKKEILIYFLWMGFSFLVTQMFTKRYSLIGTITSLDTGMVILFLFITLIHQLIWNTKIKEQKFLKGEKLPKTIISIIVAIVVLAILSTIIFGPNFIISKVKAFHQITFKPVTGRWSVTVAENRQPDFREWSSSFGPFLNGIPIMFWLFFLGSVLLFKKMIERIKKKDVWVLISFYILFFLGMVFSRYSGSSVFNGENLISKSSYYGSALLFIGGFIYFFYRYFKEKNDSFETIDYEYVLLMSIFVLTLFTARSAVRLIMVLGPIAAIFVGYAMVESVNLFRKTKDDTYKVIFGALAVIIVIAGIFIFYNFYHSIKAEAYNFVPSVYNHQWQKAMQWVRDETPKDAVFAHWWDYGYWLQSIGNRATVLDGGNNIVFWNYWMGRLVLTGDNQKDSLDFLYSHNSSYLLIDSSDIGKYGAFASIGSNGKTDAEMDRYSWIGTFLLDEKQTQETNNQTLLVYTGGVATDEDLEINDSGKKVYLPGRMAGVGLIVIPIEKTANNTEYGQPFAIMVYQRNQYRVSLRYLSVNGKFYDFKTGIEACPYVFPEVIQEGQGVRQNPMGAIMYLSPRLLRGYLAQKYILNDPFNKFPNFKLAHNESNLIIDSLNSQGMNLPEFVYFQGVQGPIKIWKIEYTGKEKVKPEYLERDSSKYLDWRLT